MTRTPRAEIRAALRSTADDLLGYFERRVQTREDAADLLGETMLQAWRRIDAFPTGEQVRQRMWLFTIAAHVLANHHRSTNRRIALAERLRAQLATTPPTVDPAEASAVRDTVHRLKDTHRELVMLIHWDGFSLVEAAEILDMNASTARSRYAAARAMLTDALAETVSR